MIEPQGRGVLDAPDEPGHDNGVWGYSTDHFHAAILPLICPTEQQRGFADFEFLKTPTISSSFYFAWGCFRIFWFECAAPAATLLRQPPPSR
ncbi:hypothetical protein [Bradyrhizobium sp. RDT46]|uniref:hypothetical protein n=1 Tax=Bradyrhizobium sp. RDT46 TaxID=3341829 RepID=UPI0035C6F022